MEMRREVTPSRKTDYHKWENAPCEIKSTGQQGKVISVEKPWVYIRLKDGEVQRFNRDEITIFRTDAYSKQRRKH